MSDHAKKAAVDPDSSATLPNDAAIDKNATTSPTTTNLEDGDHTAKTNASNGAKPGESGQEASEGSSKVENEDENNSRGDSKRNSNIQKDRIRSHYSKRQNKSKFDPNSKPASDDAAARATSIRNQVDFYFSDSNLPTDTYLWGLTDGASNLPVKISLIHNFGRMRKYKYPEIVAALRESVTLNVTGQEGLEEVKRKIPYDPNKKDVREPRTVYVKGFGEELPTTQFDIEAFFAQYGPTNSVRLRRADDKLFKGSCYIEFQDEETAQNFLALDPKPLWQGKHELEIMSMKSYKEMKNQMIKTGQIEPNETRPFRGHGKGGHRGGFKSNQDKRDKGDRDPDDWKKRREDDQKSGFRDNKRYRDHRNHSGKGSRGQGRGNDKDRRNNDGDRIKPGNDSNEGNKNMGDASDIKLGKEKPNKKREREDDIATDEVPSKKLDQKEEVGADIS